MKPLLEVKDLSAFYGSTRVLDKISFILPKIGATGLIGPNGAGKTTLLKSLLGFVQADGMVTFDQIQIRNGKLLKQNFDTIRRDIGYLPEQSRFYKHLSCREFLQFVGNLLEYNEEKILHKVEMLLDYFSLTRWADRFVHELSKGNLQRLSLAVTFMQEPKLLLLDEPLSGLAPGGRKTLLDLIKQFSTTGIPQLGIENPGSVLLSSHILGDLEQVCHRYILLSETGKMIWQGSVEEIDQLPNISSIEELYLKEIVE